MSILTTTLYGIAYADSATALGDYPTVTQQAATTIDAALARGGVVPPGAADLTAEANTRAAADTALAARLTRLEGAWTAVTTTTTFTQLATASGAVITGMSQTIPSIPAGHQAEIELAVPSLSLPASTTVQVILQDATGTVVVLDAAEKVTGAGSTAADPVRLSGQITAGGTDLANRVVRAWLIQPAGASSATLKAAGGAPVRLRYRLR